MRMIHGSTYQVRTRAVYRQGPPFATTLRRIFLLTAGLLNLPALAEKAPLSSDELRRQADAVMIATIEDIRLEVEPAAIDRGLGNSDWGIYLTLKPDTVEAGQVTDEVIEVRCFRWRTRMSLVQRLTPTGHRPIPGRGARVRVYLQKRGDSWTVLLPNGITSIGGFDGQQVVLEDAVEVKQLRQGHTLLLPLEHWLLAAIAGIPLTAFWMVTRRSRRQHRSRGD